MELKYVPAPFHVGSSMQAFGRNQALVTTQDIGYTTETDIISAPGVAVYDYDKTFHLSM